MLRQRCCRVRQGLTRHSAAFPRSKGHPLLQSSSIGSRMRRAPKKSIWPSALLVDAFLCDSLISVHLSDAFCDINGDFFCRCPLSVPFSLCSPEAILFLGQGA